MLQMFGVDGLKAAGGSLAFNVGEYDQLTKVFFLSPGPARGLLKAFAMPKVDLKPEPWVPATVASYESFSWDLDNAYATLTEMANNFGAGALIDNVEKGLVPPNGGEPLSFKKDLFGPLGNRFTVIGDFKKPINEDSQRILLAVALQDAKKFQATLTKLFAIAKVKPKTREFQGTTIYDIELPNAPMPPTPPAAPSSRARSAWPSPRITSSPPPSRPSWSRSSAPAARPWPTSPGYQAVAQLLPEKASLVSFDRSEEQARLLYDMVKTGNFQKALQGGQHGRRPRRRQGRRLHRPRQAPRVLRLRQVPLPRAGPTA